MQLERMFLRLMDIFQFVEQIARIARGLRISHPEVSLFSFVQNVINYPVLEEWDAPHPLLVPVKGREALQATLRSRACK